MKRRYTTNADKKWNKSFRQQDVRKLCRGAMDAVSFHGSLQKLAPALLSLQDVVTGAVLLLLVAIVATLVLVGYPVRGGPTAL
jgi:hypothetical protein